jgi:two-component system sensor histidine kinase UhpB
MQSASADCFAGSRARPASVGGVKARSINPTGSSRRKAADRATRSSLAAALAGLGATLTDTPVIEQFVQALGAALALVDTEAQVRWTNPAFDELLGNRLTEGAQWGAQIELTLEHDGAMRRALAGDSARAITRSTTTSTELELRYSPVFDGKRVIGLAIVAEDVSTRRAVEVALRQTRFLLQQLAAASSDYVFVLDRDFTITFASRGMRDASAEALVGVDAQACTPPELFQQIAPVLRRVRDTAQADRFTLRVPQEHGDVRHFDLRLTPVRREGEVAALTVIASETTEQMRAERAIATQARMIESMLEGVAVVNDEQVIEITNPAFDAMFGFRRGELIGRPLASLAVTAVAEMADWKPAQTTRKANSLQLEFDGQRRDGSVFAVAGVLSRFEISGRNQSLVVLQDVSERKQLERAILQAVNREQHRVGNDLHDGLGQELTGIALMLRGVAGRLQTEYPLMLPEIDGITKLVNNAIESTRSLARGLSPVNLERGGLKDALEGLAMHASELYGAQVSFAHRLQGAKPLSVELANHMYRIAQEAVRNAVKHGGARVIRLHLSIARGKVRLVIADDGSGLPDDALEAPGMGLKIMRYRARMVGGIVKFEPAEPRGTRVICECPLELLSADTEKSAPRSRRRRPASANDS